MFKKKHKSFLDHLRILEWLNMIDSHKTKRTSNWSVVTQRPHSAETIAFWSARPTSAQAAKATGAARARPSTAASGRPRLSRLRWMRPGRTGRWADVFFFLATKKKHVFFWRILFERPKMWLYMLLFSGPIVVGIEMWSYFRQFMDCRHHCFGRFVFFCVLRFCELL